MLCKYCKIEMEAVGLGTCNGWECPKCHHYNVEMGSYKLQGEPEVTLCNCINCATIEIYNELWHCRKLHADCNIAISKTRSILESLGMIGAPGGVMLVMGLRSLGASIRIKLAEAGAKAMEIKRTKNIITCPRCSNTRHFLKECYDQGGMLCVCQECGEEIHVEA